MPLPLKILPSRFETFPLLSRLLLSCLLFTCSVVAHADYVQDRDLISLHYDHAPDRDDGHATVSALDVVSSYGIQPHVVSGAYGQKNKNSYQNGAEAVMRATWGSNWVNAHNNKNNAANNTANVWLSTLDNGGDIWVAEGGQADFTAAVIKKIKSDRAGLNTKQRIHVVQHSTWNENQSTNQDLNYVKANTDYIKIADGNGANGTADLNQKNANFVNKAKASRFGSAWRAAFNYLDPINKKLDFSDTVELLHILGIGKNRVANVADFGNVFLSGQRVPPIAEPVTPTPAATPEPTPVNVEPTTPAPTNTAIFPDCSAAIVDDNGDGYGWENNQSCTITASNTAPVTTTTPTPTSTATPATAGFPSCSDAVTDDNGDGYGWENSRTCVITNTTQAVTPSVTPEPQTQAPSVQNNAVQNFPECTASATNNGDGYGWEDNRTCIITNDAAPQQVRQTTTQSTQSELLNYFPACSSGITDNGNGFGWENNRSCVIVESDRQAAPTQTQSTDTPYFPACTDNVQINNGDGYGWEFNRTCIIQTQNTTGQQPNLSDYFPACSNGVTDDNGDGYGWEYNRTCLIATGQVVTTYGWENNRTCVLDTNSTTFPTCSVNVVDDNGDGYGWENNRTCTVTSNTSTKTDPALQHFPRCSASVADNNGDGFGWENNRSCLIAR